MGIYLSSLRNKYNNKKTHNVTEINNTCYICRKLVNKDELIICIYPNCKTILHSTCEDIYRHNRNYCKCPSCGKTGTLGKPRDYLLKK